MKVFIVAALLVASVAGQSLDMYRSRTNNKDLITSRRGLSSFYPFQYGGGDYSNNMINNNDYYNYDYPSTYNYGGHGYEDNMNCMSYEQITSHPLFREYMTLPMFRQYWSYPMFQRYVCSTYFQRYWTLPQFQQYFVQPALFYKYIYPITQLFKYETTTVNTYTGGDYIFGGNTNRNGYPMEQDYYYGQQQQLVNGGIPTVCRYNTMYCQNIVQKMYNHMMMMHNGQMTTEDMMTPTTNDFKYNPYFQRMMYPNMYHNQQEMYPTVYNKEFQNFEVPSKTAFNANDAMIRPYLANARIGDKTTRDNVIVPEQVIKA